MLHRPSDHLPGRRFGITLPVEHGNHRFTITFNRDPRDRKLVERFYCHDGAMKHGSDIEAIIADACILISKRVEHGESFAEIAASLTENRVEGEITGKPASLLGAIARMGMQLEQEGQQ